MKWLRIVWSEFFGLFVDDGRFAVTILLWGAAAGLVLPRLPLPSFAPPVAFVVGLLVILAESAIRAARGARRR